jgi:hypothetical protein
MSVTAEKEETRGKSKARSSGRAQRKSCESTPRTSRLRRKSSPTARPRHHRCGVRQRKAHTRWSRAEHELRAHGHRGRTPSSSSPIAPSLLLAIRGRAPGLHRHLLRLLLRLPPCHWRARQAHARKAEACHEYEAPWPQVCRETPTPLLACFSSSAAPLHTAPPRHARHALHRAPSAPALRSTRDTTLSTVRGDTFPFPLSPSTQRTTTRSTHTRCRSQDVPRPPTYPPPLRLYV